MSLTVVAALAGALAGAAVGAIPCSNSGTLTATGGCVCDPPFSGPECVGLSIGVVATKGQGLISDFGPGVSAEKQASWGGSPIGPDPEGQYHLFFSWFKTADNTTVPSIKWWYNTSVVAHAVSNAPDHGFVFKGEVLPPRGKMFFDGSTTHNPTVVQLADGTYAIYYIGLNCHNYSAHPDPNGPDKGQSECIKHQWIGVAHADSLHGPWERPASPVLTGAPAPSWEGGMVANPGVVVTANGSLLMAYRGLNDRGIGMAVSPRWDQPFTRLNGGAPVLGPSANPPTPVDEDMTMWTSKRGLQMIMHQEGMGSAVAAHAYSTDGGLSWTMVGGCYNLTVATASGGVTYVRRERPQLLKGPGGVPTHLFNGVADPGANAFTHTIAVPFTYN